ncbi:hypothetical protein ACTMU2_24250 [Cupriavidus basilensis]
MAKAPPSGGLAARTARAVRSGRAPGAGEVPDAGHAVPQHALPAAWDSDRNSVFIITRRALVKPDGDQQLPVTHRQLHHA